MIKLHGTTLSNYFSTAKLAFVEKNVPFEEVSIMPSQEPEVLAVSPMGKVPYIEVDGTTLSETNVIFDYLEDIQPQPALYPSDAWAKAKTKEIIRVVELYLDTPARRHLPSVYFGAPVNQTAYKQVRPELDKGLRALKQLARFEPYIAGDSFTFADIAAYFQLRFTNLHTTKIYDWDITDALPGLGTYLAMLGQRPSVKAVDSVMQEALAGFLPK
jgi:glutathione S-transferase